MQALTVASHMATRWRAAMILRAWQCAARKAHVTRGTPSERAAVRWAAAASAGKHITVDDTQAVSAACLMWAALGNDAGGRPAASPSRGATLRGVAIGAVAAGENPLMVRERTAVGAAVVRPCAAFSLLWNVAKCSQELGAWGLLLQGD